MRAEIYSLNQLRDEIKRLESQPQSAGVEWDVSMLLVQEKALRCRLIAQAADKELIFLRAYKQTGKMEAVRFDGARMDGKPIATGNAVQDVWNVRNEAKALAAFAVGLHWSELN